jgi:predicted nucleic-acid-binding protein
VKQYLLDSNYILRLITQDNLDNYKIARRAFDNAKNGNYKLIIILTIVAEVVYGLNSKNLYNLAREVVVKALKIVLNQKNVIIEEKETVLLALDIYRQKNIDFADCFLIAKNKINNLDGTYTFDKKILSKASMFDK